MIKYAEFCAGVGGFRLGIELSSYMSKCVYKNEIDLKCDDTYYRNFGEHFDSRDIFDLQTDEIPEIDILCSGFPCQPFSIAGKQKGLADNRGKVILRLLEIVQHTEPKVVFLENVANLHRHDQGKTFQLIVNSLKNLGYQVFDQILDSSYFSVPQSRTRLYIVAFNVKKTGSVSFSFPAAQNNCRKTIRDILEAGDNSIPISKRWEEYLDFYLGAKSEAEVSFPIPRTRKQIESVAKDCNLKDCVLQIRSSGIRAYSLDGPFPTFAVSNSGGGAMIPVLTKERRHFNLMEMKRIMGFPDTFSFGVSRTDSIKQLANAVCPPVICAIYSEIVKAAHFPACTVMTDIEHKAVQIA